MAPALITLPWDVDDGIGARARLGLVVLESDLTIETELRRLPLDGVAFNHTRIANDTHVTPETLLAMADRIPGAMALLPESVQAVAYCCTSASTLIGDEVVEEAVHRTHPNAPVTNPIKATIAACAALGLGDIGVVTPYTEDVTLPIIERMERDGPRVAAFGSFLVDDDRTVACLSPESIERGLARVGEATTCDGFFVSCTSVRLFDDVERLEEKLGVPVLSSNLAVAWHLLRLAGIDDQFDGFGALFRDA